MAVKLVHLNQISGDLYVVRPFTPPVDPGYGVPGGGPHPGHELPHLPGQPDNSLPTVPPPQVMPGWTIVLARTADGKWHWATMAPTDTVPKPVPEPLPPGGAPDQGLPPQVWPPAQPAPTPTPHTTY